VIFETYRYLLLKTQLQRIVFLFLLSSSHQSFEYWGPCLGVRGLFFIAQHQNLERLSRAIARNNLITLNAFLM
jgi:hypothetical protein